MTQGDSNHEDVGRMDAHRDCRAGHPAVGRKAPHVVIHGAAFAEGVRKKGGSNGADFLQQT
jgi:hypothetical protein